MYQLQAIQLWMTKLFAKKQAKGVDLFNLIAGHADDTQPWDDSLDKHRDLIAAPSDCPGKLTERNDQMTDMLFGFDCDNYLVPSQQS